MLNRDQSRKDRDSESASGNHTRSARFDCPNPSLILATKFSPRPISISQSQSSKLAFSSAAANLTTNSLSFVLWERKTFICSHCVARTTGWIIVRTLQVFELIASLRQLVKIQS